MLSGIQKKLINRFKEYYGFNYDRFVLGIGNTVEFYYGDNVLIVEYDGRVIYDTKRHINIR